MRARLIMEYSKWARRKNKNILTEPKEGLKIGGGGGAINNSRFLCMMEQVLLLRNSAKISGPIANQPPSGSAGPVLLDR